MNSKHTHFLLWTFKWLRHYISLQLTNTSKVTLWTAKPFTAKNKSVLVRKRTRAWDSLLWQKTRKLFKINWAIINEPMSQLQGTQNGKTDNLRIKRTRIVVDWNTTNLWIFGSLKWSSKRDSPKKYLSPHLRWLITKVLLWKTKKGKNWT